MIVELIGLSGAGKTSFARAFSEEQHIPIIEVTGRARKVGLILWFIATRPRVFFSILLVLVVENKKSARLRSHKIRNLFFSTVAREQKARMSSRDCIIDEGLLQFFLSLYERPVNEQDVSRYLARIVDDRKVIILEAEYDVRIKRMKTRGRFPRSFMGEAYQRRWLSLVDKNYDLFKTFVKKQFSCKVVSTN
jgi:dephospho-CoA kinase